MRTLVGLIVSRRPGAGAALFLKASAGGRLAGSRRARPESLCLAASAGSLARPDPAVTRLARRTALRRPAAGRDGAGAADLVALPIDRGAERLGVLVACPGAAPGEALECWRQEVRAVASGVAALLADERPGAEPFAARGTPWSIGDPTVAHDIRSSLAVVKLTARLVQQAVDEEQRGRFLGRLTEMVDQMGELIDAGLAAARLEAELRRLHVVPVNLRELVDGVLAATAPELGPRHVVAVEIPPGLLIHGDPSALWRVLANLIGNAIKYSTEGGTIEVAAAATDEGVAVSVSDHGIGIPAERLGHVFEQFYRAPESAGVPGFGLGLYTCRRVVEAHGGRIRAVSAPGRGATFTFVVPTPRSEEVDT